MASGVRIVDKTAAAMREISRRTDADMAEVAEEMTEVTKDEAPVDIGNLQGSVTFRQEAERYYRVLTQTAGIKGQIGYGAYVELGTISHAPNPFMARGWAIANRAKFG